MIADLQGDLAEEVAAGIRSRGGECEARAVDVTDFPAVERLVGEVLEAHGRLDYLFNNAGIGIAGEVEQCGVEDWYQVLDVNLRGGDPRRPGRLPEHEGAGLRAHRQHRLDGRLPAGAAGSASYCASKHAVVGLSTSLRIEAASAGVRVSAICPGVIRTPILENAGRYGKLLIRMPLPFQRRLIERLRPMEPGPFADKALRAVAANRAIIVVPWQWRIAWWILRLSPSLGLALSGRIYRKTKRELEAYLAEENPPSVPPFSKGGSRGC